MSQGGRDTTVGRSERLERGRDKSNRMLEGSTCVSTLTERHRLLRQEVEQMGLASTGEEM